MTKKIYNLNAFLLACALSLHSFSGILANEAIPAENPVQIEPDENVVLEDSVPAADSEGLEIAIDEQPATDPAASDEISNGISLPAVTENETVNPDPVAKPDFIEEDSSFEVSEESQETDVLYAHTHTPGTAVFTWSQQDTVCHCSLPCSSCGEIIASGKCTITTMVTEATVEKEGSIRKTASFNYDGKTYSSVKTIPVPYSHTHTFDNPDFAWNGPLTKCTLTLTCSGCNDMYIRDCSITKTVVSKPTESKAGVTRYVATANVNGLKFTDTKEVSTLPFVDVAINAWYHDSVKDAWQSGLMTGTDSTHFSPDATMTRGMVATVLHRMAGKPKPKSTTHFTDVKQGLYFTEPISWMYENGIISGYSGAKAGQFGPSDPVTREQMAIMIHNFLTKSGVNTSGRKSVSGFADAKQASSSALNALEYCNYAGIMSGSSNGLQPKGYAYRSHCSKMLYQAWTKLN